MFKACQVAIFILKLSTNVIFMLKLSTHLNFFRGQKHFGANKPTLILQTPTHPVALPLMGPYWKGTLRPEEDKRKEETWNYLLLTVKHFWKCDYSSLEVPILGIKLDYRMQHLSLYHHWCIYAFQRPLIGSSFRN